MKKILVVIDMQNDFIDGALGTKEAQQIVPLVVSKIHSYPQDCIYATRDTHPENYLETQEGRNLPVSHCIEGTKGWEIRKEIADAMREVYYSSSYQSYRENAFLMVKENYNADSNYINFIKKLSQIPNE